MNYFGTTSLRLGLLAALTGRIDDAEGHFAEARRLDERLGARAWVARTLHAWARELHEASPPRAAARVGDLIGDALAITAAAGMHDLERRLLTLREDHRMRRADERVASAGDVPAPQRWTFRRSGAVWLLGTGCEHVPVPHTKGLRDIACLLARPDTDVHVLDLLGATDGPVANPHAWDHSSIRRTVTFAAGEPADAAARAAYRHRRAELRDELADAERCDDAARRLTIRRELEAIEEVLAAAYGYTRRRDAGDPIERARKTVAWRIRYALDRIARLLPPMGAHLADAIRTGSHCTYRSRPSVRWDVME
jgi:hypothetical protein